MKDSNSLPDPQNPTLLFEEYLRAMDAGQPVDMTELCARAGPREGDLKKRIDIFRTLQELSDTLDGAPGGGASAAAGIERIGRFERLVRIGQGGLSQVFLGYDPTLKRNVALKILSPDQIATSDARGWIASEAQSLARLDHPGVVRVFEIGEADGFAFIAMEFLAGPSLSAVIERLRSGKAGDDTAVEAVALRLTPIAARCRLVLQLARALAYCHEHGVVHRDVKPGNVILQASGEPKVIDFGLAHLESDEASLTQVTQRLMGTPAYVAPEQVDGGRTGASPLSDQFSLGVVLYELLTSKNAFVRPSRSATLEAISRAEPPAPRTLDASIPTDLERICLHALERVPHDRYPSMAHLADDLEAFLEHRAISVRAPTPAKALLLWTRRHEREIALSTKALACALAVAVAVWIGSALRERSRFEDDMAKLGASIEALDHPQNFNAWYGSFRPHHAEAKRLDGELAARVLGADMSAIALLHADRASQRLATVLAQEWERLRLSQPMQADHADRLLMGQWRDALASDEEYCPECLHNIGDRERGRVDLPTLAAGGRLSLWQYGGGPSPLTPALRPVDPSQLRPPGLYRLQAFDAAHELVLDTEFLVRPEQKRWRIEARPLQPAIESRMIDAAATTLDVYGAGQVKVAAYRIMRDPMRWCDLALAGWSNEKTLAEKAFVQRQLSRELDLTSPALLSWETALSVALAVGARLPTGCELLAALTSNRIETPGRGSTTAGEFVSSIITNDDIYGLPYESEMMGNQIVLTPPQYNMDGLPTGHDDTGALQLMTFRLARSSPE